MGFGGYLVWGAVAERYKEENGKSYVILCYDSLGAWAKYLLTKKHPLKLLKRVLIFPGFLYRPLKSLHLSVISMGDKKLQYWDDFDGKRLTFKDFGHCSLPNQEYRSYCAKIKEDKKTRKNLWAYINFIKQHPVILVEPHSKTEFAKTRGWSFEKFQELTFEIINRGFVVIQIGEKGKEILKGSVDYTGVSDFMGTRYLLEHALLFIGTEGGLAHLAACSNCKSIILYSSRMPASLMTYETSIIIRKDMPCSNCGLVKGCTTSPTCMELITCKDVLKEFDSNIQINDSRK